MLQALWFGKAAYQHLTWCCHGLLEVYQTLFWAGAYNFQSISAVGEIAGMRDYVTKSWMIVALSYCLYTDIFVELHVCVYKFYTCITISAVSPVSLLEPHNVTSVIVGTT